MNNNMNKTMLKPILEDHHNFTANPTLSCITTRKLSEKDLYKVKLMYGDNHVELMNDYYIKILCGNGRFKLLNSCGLLEGDFVYVRKTRNNDKILCQRRNIIFIITKDYILDTSIYRLADYSDAGDLTLISGADFIQYIVKDDGNMVPLIGKNLCTKLVYLGYNQYALIKSRRNIRHDYYSIDIIDKDVNTIKKGILINDKCLKEYGLDSITSIFNETNYGNTFINRPIV